MEDMLYKYFIEPIWAETGYNTVNTVTYAVVALLSLYAIWFMFKKYKISINRQFIFNVLAFVLFGSTLRVVTDAVKNDVFKPVTPFHAAVLSSHIYDYGYLTVSPGIYLVVAAMLFLSMAMLWLIKKPHLLGWVGIALWLPHFLLLIPFMGFAIYAIPILLLAAIPAYIAYRYFKSDILALMVAGHALDGAATFFVIDIFSKMTGRVYFEQHVLGGAIGATFGTFFVFYAVKVLLSFGIAYVLSKEKDISESEMNFIALAIMIMGFAPGIRDVLRMVVGA